MKGEERDVIIDALNSAKSAIKGGVLPGGGVALIHASKLLETGLPDMLSDPSERVGARILGQALKTPISQLLKNCTSQSGALIIDKIKNSESFFTGYNIHTEQLVDMMDEGIYDSLNVVKVVLEDAVSLASMIITTECIIVKEKGYTPLPLKVFQDK